MATPISRISIFSNGTYSVQSNTQYVGLRCLHMAEGGYPNPEGMPCVRPSEDAQPIIFTEAMQLLSYEINKTNPYFTKDKWRVVYRDGLAFTNGQGFDPRDGTKRRDYVNRRDLFSEYPKLMKAIICGGMFLRANVIGNDVICMPGIHAIDVRKPLPSIETIIANNWYFVATTGGAARVSNFPQGDGLPVIIPFFLKEPAVYPMVDNDGHTWFEPWNQAYLPDPLKFYKV